MGHRHGFIALLAALFALQAPLCGVVCAAEARAPETASVHASADVGAAHAAPAHAAPCHDAPASAPHDDPRDAHDDCGCEAELEQVVSSKAESLSRLALAAPAAQAPAALRPEAARRPRTHVPDPARLLPPPDILLLHSTLLI